MAKQKGTIWLAIEDIYRLQVLLIHEYVIKQGLHIGRKVVKRKLLACLPHAIPYVFFPIEKRSQVKIIGIISQAHLQFKF